MLYIRENIMKILFAIQHDTTFWMQITLKMAALSVDTFLTNIRTDVALQKSPRNTKKVSGSISILMQVIFFNKYYLACNNA